MRFESDDTVICRTPTPGKQPTRIARWKYDRIRTAILRALPSSGRGVAFKELPDLVKINLSDEDLKALGSVSWYTTTVKLELEVAGEIERLPRSNPQRLLRLE